MDKNQIKIMGIFAILLQIFSIIILYNSPAAGYELSIYSNINYFMYIFLFSSFAIGLLILILEINLSVKNNEIIYSENLSFILGFIIIILTIITVLSLPIIKNYLFYDFADTFTHLGTIKDILMYNNTPATNFYPIMHIWISENSLISGILSIKLMKYFPLVLSLLFIVSIYLWSNSIFKEKSKVVITTIFGIIPFLESYNTVLVPNGFSMMLVPLILYIYLTNIEKKKIELAIIFIIFLIMIPFSHPLTTLMLILFLIIIEISNRVYEIITGTEKTKISFNAALFLIISFFTWISSYTIFNNSLSRVSSWLNGELRPPLDQVSGSIGKLNLSIEGTIFLFLKTYGYDFLLVVLGLIASIVIFIKLKNRIYVEKKIFSIVNCFIFSAILMIVLIFTGDPNFEAIRSLKFVFLMGVPLSGYITYELIIFSSKHNAFVRKGFYGFLVIILLVGFIISTFSIYDSPITEKPSLDTSNSHFDGLTWFFEHKDINIRSSAMQSAAPWRFSEAINGEKISEDTNEIGSSSSWYLTIPDHFGYQNYTYLGNYFNESRYMPVSKVDILSYLSLWKVLNRYNETDFKRLDTDKTVMKIYDSNDISIYTINF